ncbi:UNVERIFIED_CONTAM: hypothetical protein Slati_0879300 [Sesamum latifolium]|uniref:Reverse transcriptase domain-containing protein n=1 Tax=Sesamum latifolium TaxID=2727402 RepID=A0AAW2XRP2_9LAMI
MKCVSTVSLSFLLNEAFSCLTHKAENEGTIQGVAVSRLAPLVSHLLFADDTLIFCQAMEEALSRLQLVLTSLEAASGLKTNKQKLAMVFMSGCSKKEMFEGIKEHIWKKLHTWSSKQLSQADFFWNCGTESKIHWVSWVKLCTDKQAVSDHYGELVTFWLLVFVGRWGMDFDSDYGISLDPEAGLLSADFSPDITPTKFLSGSTSHC